MFLIDATNINLKLKNKKKFTLKIYNIQQTHQPNKILKKFKNQYYLVENKMLIKKTQNSMNILKNSELKKIKIGFQVHPQQAQAIQIILLKDLIIILKKI